MSYNFLDIQKAPLYYYKSKKIVLYLARGKAKPIIYAIIARASTSVITSPGVSLANLSTFLVFNNRIYISVLAITSSTAT
jgi:hypothetical protein